jgi:regulator of protease activity HflC (stomatin/prohibitin superfamily)
MALSIISWIVGLFVLLIIIGGLRVIKQYEEAVVLRLGKYKRILKPGLRYVIPGFEKAYRVDLRIRTIDVEPQETISRDTVPVNVDAVIYYKVQDIKKAVLDVEEFQKAAIKLAQTTLRDIVGKSTLDQLLMKKDQIGEAIKKILDKGTDEWGIKVSNVEIKDVTIPEDLKRAMARESEAVREKRARIIKAEAELEASKKLKEASETLAKSKYSFSLRQLQTWQEIGAEQNSLMIVIPADVASKEVTGLAALGKAELDKIPKKK